MWRHQTGWIFSSGYGPIRLWTRAAPPLIRFARRRLREICRSLSHEHVVPSVFVLERRIRDVIAPLPTKGVRNKKYTTREIHPVDWVDFPISRNPPSFRLGGFSSSRNPPSLRLGGFSVLEKSTQFSPNLEKSTQSVRRTAVLVAPRRAMKAPVAERQRPRAARNTAAATRRALRRFGARSPETRPFRKCPRGGAGG